MFGIGFTEILVILVIALIAIGPEKLPEIAKALGRAFGEFKKATDDLKKSVDVSTTIEEIKPEVSGTSDTPPPDRDQKDEKKRGRTAG